jgi:hypothetical protein
MIGIFHRIGKSINKAGEILTGIGKFDVDCFDFPIKHIFCQVRPLQNSSRMQSLKKMKRGQ